MLLLPPQLLLLQLPLPLENGNLCATWGVLAAEAFQQLGRRERHGARGARVAASSAVVDAVAAGVRDLRGLSATFRWCWDEQHGAPRAVDVMLEGPLNSKPSGSVAR